MNQYTFGEKKKRVGFFASVASLIGHLIGSGIMFASFYGIIWVLSYFISWLDGVHHLPSETFELTAKIEFYLVYADAILCAMVVLAGAIRFIRDLGDLL
jgi:hypothetical protein